MSKYRITMTETVSYTAEFTRQELHDLGLGGYATETPAALKDALEDDTDTELGVVDYLVDNLAGLDITERWFRVRVTD